MRWANTAEPWAWELERGKKTWRVPVRGPVTTNSFELMRSLAVSGVGLLYALESTIADELASGKLRVLLEPYAPEVPGLFLYFPSRAQVSEHHIGGCGALARAAYLLARSQYDAALVRARSDLRLAQTSLVEVTRALERALPLSRENASAPRRAGTTSAGPSRRGWILDGQQASWSRRRADRYHAFMTKSDVLDRTRLRWLVNTYWYVQTPDLPALRYDPDSQQLDWLVDQTVWHIQGYGNGYFWGVSATLLYETGSDVPKHGPRARRHKATMLGTVTPEGRVHITFIQGSSAESAVLGMGALIEHGGVPSFEMQMSTGSRSRVLHWAYMLPVKEGEPAWGCLPGVNMSVPEFLEDTTPPIPPR